MRKLRIWISLSVFLLATTAFISHSLAAFPPFALVLKVQFVPALIQLITGGGILFVAILLFTLVFGRVYCSFLCPLGIYQDMLIHLALKTGMIRAHQHQKRFRALQYTIAGITCLTLVYGSLAVVNLLDPFTVYGRFTVHLFKPLVTGLNNLLVAVLEAFDLYVLALRHSNETPLPTAAVTLCFLVIVSLMALFKGRLYCNSVCPVGLILAKLAAFSHYKFTIDEENCAGCGRCEKACKAGCIDMAKLSIDPEHCVACFNCKDACEKQLISYSAGCVPSNRHPVLRRRQLLSMSFVASGLLFSVYSPLRTRNWGLAGQQIPVLPPGAQSIDRFTRTCTACQLCISACPTHVMRPTLLGYGLSGLMLPRLALQKAHCDYDCNACGRVCPTGAIAQLPLSQKKRVRIGKVSLNPKRCIIHVKKKHCGACGEACPTRAIYPVEKDKIIYPEIDPSYCIGCGACEHACPTKPKAIFVTAIAVHGTADRYTSPKKETLEIPGDAKGFPF